MAKQPLDPPQPDDASPIPDDLQVLFGRNLRAARLAHSLTHQELADKAGFKRQYVSRIEAGQLNVTLDTMKRLAAALGQDVSTMLRLPDTHDVSPGVPKPPG
jgi:transcriptional regulator with XRE-family HTH domain